MAAVGGEGIGAARHDLEFRLAALLDKQPVGLARDRQHAAGRQFVGADIGVELLRIDSSIAPCQFGDAGSTHLPAILVQRQFALA
jgi:hypothetical protein